MLLNGFGKGVALVALVGLAACASTETQDTSDMAQDTVMEPVVQEPTGPVPGSVEDFKATAEQRVFFGYDQYNLTNEARATLARQAAWLKEYPETRIRIEGNCDERGTREYNFALGARRANQAKEYLVSLGVDASRIAVHSNGKENPVDPRSTPEAWRQNRNATTVVTSTGVGA